MDAAVAFFTTPLGLVVAIAAVILAIRCLGELLAFAARAAVVLVLVGVVAYFLGWQPPVLSDDAPAVKPVPAQPPTVPVRWRI